MPILAAVAVPHPPLILPEVGQGEEKQIQKTIDAYQEAMAFLAGFQPETVVLISPHTTLYSDWFHISPGAGARGDFSRFRAPSVQIEAQYDQELASFIEEEAQRRHIPAGTAGEREPELDHATMIPLYFLNKVYPDYKLVRIGLSGLPMIEHYRLGECITAAARDKRVAIIGSGDLSHKLKSDGPYGFVPEGPELDKQITEALGSGDFSQLLHIDTHLAEKGAECGLRSFAIMAGTLDGRRVESKLLSYEGTFGVGYAVATFLPGTPDESRQFDVQYESEQKHASAKKRESDDPYVRLARYSVERFVSTGTRAPLPEDLPDEMMKHRAGAFVSLHRYGELRGCIGTISPTMDNVASEILYNAVSACSQDPRFPPVQPDELDTLEISVDVLGEPESIQSMDELDPKKYGVIVSSGVQRGLLLPDLDGVDTAEQQVSIARRKAGIAPNEPVHLERFRVVRHE